MTNNLLITIIFVICGLMTSQATDTLPHKPQIFQTCPIPTREMLKCLNQYICQHAIRLDLRCLLNLNGTPLLGGILGGSGGGSGAPGGGGLLGGGLLGGSNGGGTGIVGSLLGR